MEIVIIVLVVVGLALLILNLGLMLVDEISTMIKNRKLKKELAESIENAKTILAEMIKECENQCEDYKDEQEEKPKKKKTTKKKEVE